MTNLNQPHSALDHFAGESCTTCRTNRNLYRIEVRLPWEEVPNPGIDPDPSPEASSPFTTPVPTLPTKTNTSLPLHPVGPLDGGWTGSLGLPTFVLDGDITGSLTEDAAKAVVLDAINMIIASLTPSHPAFIRRVDPKITATRMDPHLDLGDGSVSFLASGEEQIPILTDPPLPHPNATVNFPDPNHPIPNSKLPAGTERNVDWTGSWVADQPPVDAGTEGFPDPADKEFGRWDGKAKYLITFGVEYAGYIDRIAWGETAADASLNVQPSNAPIVDSGKTYQEWWTESVTRLPIPSDARDYIEPW